MLIGIDSCESMKCFMKRKFWAGPIMSLLMVHMSLWYWASTFSASLVSSELSAPSRQELASNVPPFRMLLGIFSIANDAGKERRDLIRRTYLSLPRFLENHGVSTIPLRHARICSLDEYWRQSIPHHEQCQLLYTFVLGAAADPKAPVEYLTLEPDRPMTVNVSTLLDPEPDVTYLNIRENMNFGKTNTWFKYASNMLPESLQIDIIAKVDTDCLIRPNILLDEMEHRIVPGRMVYGGSEIHNDKGHHYMQGGFYFLSRYLAQLITLGRDDRWHIILEFMPFYRLQRPEDVETGQLVKHYGGDNVDRIDIQENFAYVHNKKLKQERFFLEYWDTYSDDLIAQDHLTNIQRKHNTNCPSPEVLAEEGLTLPTVPVGAAKRFEELAIDLVEECQFLTTS